MESKYIKGTDKKYSIREDGLIFSHISNRTLTTNNKGKVQIKLFGRYRLYVIRTLMRDYFDKAYCITKNCTNTTKKTSQQYCDTCIKIRNAKSTRNHLKKRVKYIHRSYVQSKLGIKKEDLTDSLYNLYKANLETKRLISDKTGIPTRYLHTKKQL